MDNGRTSQYWAEHFIRFLLDGKREVTAEEIELRKEGLGLSWLTGPFVVAMVAPDYSAVPAAQKDQVFREYEAYVDRAVAELPGEHACLINSYNNIVVLLALQGGEVSAEKLNGFFIELHEKLTERFGLEVFIGIGSPAKTYQGIADSASDAQEMLGFKFQYADRGVVNISNMVQFQYNVSRGNGVAFDRVIGCFKDGDLGKMELRLNELVETVRHRPNVSKTSIRRSLVEVTVQILHTASNANEKQIHKQLEHGFAHVIPQLLQVFLKLFHEA